MMQQHHPPVAAVSISSLVRAGIRCLRVDDGDTGSNAGQRDTITDFVKGTDKIDLTGIDAPDTPGGGLDCLSLSGSGIRCALRNGRGSVNTALYPRDMLTVLEGGHNWL